MVKLFEGYRDGFSFETLSVLGGDAFSDWRDWEKQYNYCEKWLGRPDGFGTSRCVFTLNDNFVLKLAYGDKYEAGKAQNEAESKIFEEYDSPLIPRIIYCDNNYSFLVTESVVPAKSVDFEKILGIPFDKYYTQKTSPIKKFDSKNGGDIEIGFDAYFDPLKIKYRGAREEFFNAKEIITYILKKVHKVCMKDGRMEYFINGNKWFEELESIAEKTKMLDLANISNFGVVNRNGNPMIVILDCGFNFDIYYKYYKKNT